MGRRGFGTGTEFPALADLPLAMPLAGSTPMSRGAVRWKLESGRWQLLHPGVYVTHNGPVDWPTRAAGALLAATRPSVVAIRQARERVENGEPFWLPPRPAGLGGWAAGYVDGLTDAPPDTITLVVPRARVITPPKSCEVIRSDVQRLRNHTWPPRSSVESTVIHLAESLPLDGALALIGRALQQHRTTMVRLGAEMQRWPRHPRRGVLSDLLTSDADGAESALELRWVRDVERRHALPPASRQARQVIAGVGRRHDLEYDDASLRVELDGFLFHDRARSRSDRQKSNASTITGRGQLRYGWAEVSQDPCGTAAELVIAARLRGVNWPVRSCRRPGCPVGVSPRPPVAGLA